MVAISNPLDNITHDEVILTDELGTEETVTGFLLEEENKTMNQGEERDWE